MGQGQAVRRGMMQPIEPSGHGLRHSLLFPLSFQNRQKIRNWFVPVGILFQGLQIGHQGFQIVASADGQGFEGKARVTVAKDLD